MRHRVSYVNEVLSQIQDLRNDVDGYAESLEFHIKSLDEEIQSHLWVAADFAGPARANLAATKHAVDELRVRVIRLRDGFASLPREREVAVPANAHVGKGPKPKAGPAASA